LYGIEIDEEEFVVKDTRRAWPRPKDATKIRGKKWKRISIVYMRCWICTGAIWSLYSHLKRRSAFLQTSIEKSRRLQNCKEIQSIYTITPSEVQNFRECSSETYWTFRVLTENWVKFFNQIPPRILESVASYGLTVTN
jgi:uncharacterized membrane protein